MRLQQLEKLQKPNAVFWIGLIIYATSFFLVSTMDPGEVRGYKLAWTALILPFSRGASWERFPVLMPSTVLVGLINPIFIAALLAFLKGSVRAFKYLRMAVLSLFPFCWIVFILLDMRPWLGYFVWTLGMVLSLFSASWFRNTDSPTP